MTGAALKKLRDLLGGFSEVRCDGDVCIASIRLARQSTNGGSDQFHRDLMRLQPAIAESGGARQQETSGQTSVKREVLTTARDAGSRVRPGAGSQQSRGRGSSPDRSAAEAELRRGIVTPRAGTSYFHGRRARLLQSATFCATGARRFALLCVFDLETKPSGAAKTGHYRTSGSAPQLNR
jgi:hypothetical protein